MNENEIQQEGQRIEETVNIKEESSEMKVQTKNTIQKIKEKVQEDDPKPSSAMTLRTILGGDFLTAERFQIPVPAGPHHH